MESKEERAREIKREATTSSANKYFDVLYDNKNAHKKDVRIRYVDKDDEVIEINRSSYDLPFLIEEVSLSINEVFDLKIGTMKIKRDNIKSIEIIFE